MVSLRGALYRRHFLQTAIAAAVAPKVMKSAVSRPFSAASLLQHPRSITAFTEAGSEPLNRTAHAWQSASLELELALSPHQLPIRITGSKAPLLRLRLRWEGTLPAAAQYLGDAWERSYGDLGWRTLDPERILPWYFLAADLAAGSTLACGVRTNPAAFCFWQVDASGVSLWLDLRNGGSGTVLGKRRLTAATVVSVDYPGISPFEAARRFCAVMNPAPRLASKPIFGGNNWYYAYGKSSAEDIRADSERISSLAPGLENRPFMVIDDGWSPAATAGPWDRGNARFPDMQALAADMVRIGVRPGIWCRPLFTEQNVPDSWRLASPASKKTAGSEHRLTLDPTVPEVAAQLQKEVQTFRGWGYQLVKHDFSTYDFLGRWGFTMGPDLTDANWHFTDRSRTTAEIVRAFYQLLRDAAGDTYLLGCNTIGHLGAGLFELQRTGDDTSGRVWERTRKMGINTLAFRAPQQGTFFGVDADCVGLTREIPWSLNRQWLDLLARSGTPLFVSAAPDAVGAEQRDALRAAFARASRPLAVGEPLDWMQTTQPRHWRFGPERQKYDWYEDGGGSPFAH